MKRKINVIFTAIIILICWIIPDTSRSQIAVRLKRSNELTRSAAQLFQEQKVDEAKKQLEQAIRLNPKNVLAHEFLALVFYQEHNFLGAKKQANLAVKLNKKAPKAHYVLGMINFQKGNHELAELQLRLAVDSLKEPEYRQRAKNMLEKIKENSKQKSPEKTKADISLKDEIAETPLKEVEYKPYIAVFQFEDANTQTELTRLGQTLTEMLITALIQGEKFNVMERVQLEKILKEQSLSQTGVIDAEMAIEVGKLSGLEGVVVGSISQLKTSIEADARLIQVETGKAMAAASSNVNRVADIRGLANDLANQLSAKAYLIVQEADSSKAKTQELEMQKW